MRMSIPNSSSGHRTTATRADTQPADGRQVIEVVLRRRDDDAENEIDDRTDAHSVEVPGRTGSEPDVICVARPTGTSGPINPVATPIAPVALRRR